MQTAIVSFLAFTFGVFLGIKFIVNAMKGDIEKNLQSRARNRIMLLSVLRRELGNILFERDAYRYLELYKDINSNIENFKNWKIEIIKEKLADLCEKYPDYLYFDALGTRDYVSYKLATESLSWDEIADHYRDLIEFTALSKIVNIDWQNINIHTTDADELNHLSEHIKELKTDQDSV